MSASPFGRRIEDFLATYLITNFAPLIAGPQTCHSLCRNPLSKENEPAGGYVSTLIPTKRSSTITPTCAVSYAPTPAAVPPLALVPASVVPMANYTNKNI